MEKTISQIHTERIEELREAPQFSIQNLMIGTAVCAVLLALAKSPFSILAVVILVYAVKWVGISLGVSKRERLYLHLAICFVTYLYLIAIHFLDSWVEYTTPNMVVVTPVGMGLLFAIPLLYFVPTFFLLVDLWADLCLDKFWVFLARSLSEIVIAWPLWLIAIVVFVLFFFGGNLNQL